MEFEVLIANLSNKVRYEQLEGVDHIVVPMVMITEGVHVGSKGPVFYPKEELEKFAGVWNTKPVIVYHPKDGNGTPISACTPVVLNERKVGIVLNTKYDNGKLKAEAWLNINRLKEVDERILDNIRSGNLTEVSTGLHSENEMASGTFKGKYYEMIARNYRPDHLAILPDEKGACSIADGAGLLANEAMRRFEFNQAKKEEAWALTNNQMSYLDITAALRSLLEVRYGYDAMIMDVYDKWFVYCFKGKCYRLTYTSTDRETTISENPIEVYEERRWLTADGAPVSNAATTTPSQENDTMDPTKLVDTLIANGGYEESDREMLSKMKPEKLTKMVDALKPTTNAGAQTTLQAGSPAAEVDAAAKAGAAGVAAPTANSGSDVLLPKAMTVDQYITNAPPEIRDLLSSGMQIQAQRRAELTQVITANARNRFKPDYLATLPLEQLEAMAALATPEQTPVLAQGVALFSGAAGAYTGAPIANSGKKEEPLGLPSMPFGS